MLALQWYLASNDLLNSVRSRKWSSIQYCIGSGQNRTIQGRTMSWSTTGLTQQWLRNKGNEGETILNIWFIHPISFACLSMGCGSSGFSRGFQVLFFFFFFSWVNSLLLKSQPGFSTGFLQWTLAWPSWSFQWDIARTLDWHQMTSDVMGRNGSSSHWP